MDKRTRSGQPSRHPGIRELNGRCQISYTDSDGKRKQVLTDHLYTEAGIKRAVQERNKRIREGEPSTQGAGKSFAEVAQIWLDTTPLTKSSRRSARNILNRYWMPTLGPMAVEEISYAILLQLFYGQNRGELSPKTLKNILAPLRGVFELAVNSDFIQVNPAKQFGKIKNPRRQVDPFSREERDALLEALSGNAKIFYTLRFYLGLRPAEVIALRWTDFSKTLETAHICKEVVDGELRSTTKTNKERTVRTTDAVRIALKDHPTRFKGGYVLINQHGEPYLGYRAFANSFNLAIQKTKIRYRSPYNCRHTAATMMLRATRDPLYVAEKLGNSVEMIYRNYAGIIFEEKDEELHKQIEEYM